MASSILVSCMIVEILSSSPRAQGQSGPDRAAPMQEEGPPDAVRGALCGHLDILPRLSWCEDDQGRSAKDGHYLGEGRVLGGKYKRFFIMLSLPCGTFHRFVLTCHYAFIM